VEIDQNWWRENALNTFILCQESLC